MAEQFEGRQIETIARALGDTGKGLSGTEIQFLRVAAILECAHVRDGHAQAGADDSRGFAADLLEASVAANAAPKLRGRLDLGLAA